MAATKFANPATFQSFLSEVGASGHPGPFRISFSPLSTTIVCTTLADLWHGGVKCPPSNFNEAQVQNRYAGDIGDYVKLALLRAITPGLSLGVAWYLFPDESHNGDGRHTDYLDQAGKWRDLDPELFDALSNTVRTYRSVRALETTGTLAGARFSGKPIWTRDAQAKERSDARKRWFDQTVESLNGCDIIFADPDNGLIDDGLHRRREQKFGKQLPINEALELANGRQAIIYHHNTRFPGGHDLEVSYWQRQLGPATIAVRATAYSCRTFFILNPTQVTRDRAMRFAEHWSRHKVRFVDAL